MPHKTKKQKIRASLRKVSPESLAVEQQQTQTLKTTTQTTREVAPTQQSVPPPKHANTSDLSKPIPGFEKDLTRTGIVSAILLLLLVLGTVFQEQVVQYTQQAVKQIQSIRK